MFAIMPNKAEIHQLMVQSSTPSQMAEPNTYVGQTDRTLRERMSGHRVAYLNRKPIPLYRHFLKLGHTLGHTIDDASVTYWNSWRPASQSTPWDTPLMTSQVTYWNSLKTLETCFPEHEEVDCNNLHGARNWKGKGS